jgi:biotin carboxyl carrier protein
MTAPAPKAETDATVPAGETLSVPERVIVAPSPGVFRRLDGRGRMNDGDIVNRGDVIGMVQSLGVSTPIQSPFAGSLMAILASEGERLRRGQAVAWVRVA